MKNIYMQMRRFWMTNLLPGFLEYSLVVEAGHYSVLEEDHPHILPVGGVEGDELVALQLR